MYIDHLVSHETLHQWWYNVVGTNGYCETWMDEGVVCYFTARRLQAKYGFNPAMLRLPHWAESAVPNLYHENYRFCGMYNTVRHKEYTATCQPLPDFGNVFTLFSMTYDRGAKLLGTITDRLGDAAFMDFMRIVYAKYQFRIIRVADFQRELEQYTGRSWKEFFDQWFFAKGMSDWAVEDVTVSDKTPPPAFTSLSPFLWVAPMSDDRFHVVVRLKQKGEFTEETVLGVKLKEQGPYAIRIPIVPGSGPIDLEVPHGWLDEPVGRISNPAAVGRIFNPASSADDTSGRIENPAYKAHVETLPDGKSVLVTIELPQEPVQISVDPDQVLPDSNPVNNHWKCPIRWRITPLMTNLDETDLMTDYDKWNVTTGPWIGLSNPAYGQAPQAGFRASAYRLQEFVGGVYAVYDAYTGDVRMGGDALLQNCPWPNVDFGFQMDHNMMPELSRSPKTQGILFGRYVFHQTASLYLEPMEFLEVYGRTGAVFWPGDYGGRSDFGRFQDVAGAGVYYHRDYLTPYWDPEAGYKFWINAEYGNALTNGEASYQKLQGECSYVQSMPDGMGYLSDTRLAIRAYGGVGGPRDAQLFQLGGPTRVRGMSWNTRDGNALWMASAEWRFPIWKDIDCDVCDHVLRMRHVYGVAYYDGGQMFRSGRTMGGHFGVVHSMGAGLRWDMAIFSFIERFTLRLDVAKMMETSEPMQMWFGLSHAF
jgi:hypothetical protein